MKTILKLFFVVLMVGRSVFAVSEFYSISKSIRSLGMGGAFYGLSNDEYALFYNPAGLSIYSGSSEYMLRINAEVAPKTLAALNTITKLGNKSIATTVNTLTEYQGSPLYLGVGVMPYFLKKHFAVGLLLADAKLDFALLGKELDSSVDLTAITDTGLFVGYGRAFLDEKLHLGLTLKALVRAGGRKTFTLTDIAKSQVIKIDPKELGGAGGGVDFDFGTTYVLPKLPFAIENRLSLVFNNLLASPFSISLTGGGRPPALNRTVSLGWYSVFSGIGYIDNFHFLLDLAEFKLGGETNDDLGSRGGSFFKHLNWGVEAPIGILSLRAGLHQGNISAGFGVNLRVVRLDFATYGEELLSGPGRLTSRRYDVSLALGWGSAPAAVRSATDFSPEQPKKKTSPDQTVEKNLEVPSDVIKKQE